MLQASKRSRDSQQTTSWETMTGSDRQHGSRCAHRQLAVTNKYTALSSQQPIKQTPKGTKTGKPIWNQESWHGFNKEASSLTKRGNKEKATFTRNNIPISSAKRNIHKNIIKGFFEDKAPSEATKPTMPAEEDAATKKVKEPNRKHKPHSDLKQTEKSR
jgi:hypothetical protein